MCIRIVSVRACVVLVRHTNIFIIYTKFVVSCSSLYEFRTTHNKPLFELFVSHFRFIALEEAEAESERNTVITSYTIGRQKNLCSNLEKNTITKSFKHALSPIQRKRGRATFAE